MLPNQAELEKLLLAWIQYHDSTNGGRIPLPVNIILEQAKLIAAEAKLVFNPNEFNSSTKWLYRFKIHNNIKHTHFHGEGKAADLSSIAIAR